MYSVASLKRPIVSRNLISGCSLLVALSQSNLNEHSAARRKKKQSAFSRSTLRPRGGSDLVQLIAMAPKAAALRLPALMQPAQGVGRPVDAVHPAGAYLSKQPGRSLQRIAWPQYEGPERVRNQPGTCRSIPGMATGTLQSCLTIPALPKDVALPGGRGSITVTSSAARFKYRAELTPIMPAPMTTTLLPETGMSTLIQLSLSRAHERSSGAECQAIANVYAKRGQQQRFDLSSRSLAHEVRGRNRVHW